MDWPKIKFINIPLSQEIDWMHGFLFQNERGWEKYIIQRHPDIKKVFSFEKEDKQIEFLKRYISKFRKEHREDIEMNRKKYEKE